YARRSAAYVVGALGILMAGAAYLPLDPADPAERLGFMMRDAGAPILVTTGELKAEAPQGSWTMVAAEAATAAGPECAGPRRRVGETLAYVIYTSGTSGRPKGVEISHDNLANLVEWHGRRFAVSAEDRAALMASPGFDAGVWELWPYLVQGASLHMPSEEERRSPAGLRDWLVAQRITMAFVPTPLAEPMLRLDWPAETALRLLLTGADTLHQHPRCALPFALINNYGPTECTVVATSGTVAGGATPGVRPSIGAAIDNVEVLILDENRKAAPVGVAGTIWIGGRGVGRGYRGQAELSAARFMTHPLRGAAGGRVFNTGDRGRWREDGEIEFLGRCDGQVKIRGYRIELEEIASVLNEHPAVAASVVRASEGASGSASLIAYVVVSAGAHVDARTLRQGLRQRLPDYMLPSQFVRLEAVPMTARGKVDTARLPEPEAANRLEETEEKEACAEPHSPVEEQLLAMVSRVLGLEAAVGVEDNFFLLGGHSFLGTQLIAQVREHFGVDLTLRALFDHPTVGAMTGEVEALIEAKLEAMSEEEAEALLQELEERETEVRG
ncbi:MAG: non-ribosomal peptide synthetase, partial [Terriglobales bacterium]